MIKPLTYWLFLALAILVGHSSNAQNLTASAPSQVQVGQRFQVTWSLDGNGSSFTAPEITDFQVLGGPNQSTQMQYINGSMSQSVSYSYVLQAVKEGTFKIGPAKINAGGKVIASNTLNVNVLNNNNQKSTATNNAQQKTQANASATDSKDIFIRIETSKRSAYLGEKITANIKIYNRVTIVDFADWKMPSYEGFWNKETNANKQFQWKREMVDGVVYETGIIKQVILYPQKSGDITIAPMEVAAIVRERTTSRGRSMLDQFFGGYQDVRKPIKSNSATINVEPYPGGKPSNFSGLTGDLKMKAQLDKNEIAANEAVNLKVTISGDGNLYQLQPLDLEFPPDIEVYDPKTADNITVNANGISGSRTFEYVLIPRYAGDFKIGPFSFSYFDSKTNTFKTVTQEAFDLIVEKGEGEETSNQAVNIANKEDIKLIGSDIRYIKQGQYPILNGTNFFYRSVPFYAAIGVPLMLFFLLIGYVQYQKAQGKDVVRLKSKRATGLAKKRLTKAKKLWDDNQTASFYEEVFKALTDYAASKFGIPVAQLNKDNIRSTFSSRNVPDDVTNEFVGVLDKSEFARFAPGADKEMGSIYDEALQAIVNVENHA